MKRGTLLALAVAGALGSSVSSAETFLCRTPSDLSYTACVPTAFDPREPTVVQYYTVERQPSVVLYEPAVTRAPAIVAAMPAQPPHLTVTTYEHRSWPNTEPIIKQERYYYY